MEKGSRMGSGEGEASTGVGGPNAGGDAKKKPPFRPAKDDTKPLLRDPISRSDPIETEQAVLRLPPFPHGTTHL
ncbi:uncharacterized protein [Typha angustifolia]|uniref:uncharacterized protein n=1 Tax=Typha angustifolia TaxID=59011 RepID=UPI003C2D26C4